ncbi:hypothetical protein GO986_21740 [Deinococcus sp. HMF7620]|uniref:Transglycosylase SLT domain-containing protein n=1 Tax=Deinococcus arboris TaxID=2682977 RepID=A0A7C9LTU8_9DEIO|nr:hypothetical protein [Deinococcus arboris]MVN89361.1 hypothetical protein [Deinococcus arboris]
MKLSAASQKKLMLGIVAAGAVAVLASRAVRPAAVPMRSSPALPVVTLPAGPTTPTRPTPAPAGPTRAQLIDRCEQAILKEVPLRRLSPVATRTLALQLVTVCEEEGYPLDLAFGHAYAESALDLNAVNRSSGAAGPLQVTKIAADQVGAAWPLTTPAAKVRAGIRYMKWARSAYPECAASVRETLRHYGMGRGNWLNYRRGELTCATSLSVTRAELGCPGTRPYSATVIAIAQRHPELRTTSWWGS